MNDMNITEISNNKIIFFNSKRNMLNKKLQSNQDVIINEKFYLSLWTLNGNLDFSSSFFLKWKMD